MGRLFNHKSHPHDNVKLVTVGVFSAKELATKTYLCEYNGEVVDREEAARRGQWVGFSFINPICTTKSSL